MSSPIVWGELIASAALFGGVALIGLGLLQWFAASMATVPDRAAGGHGCLIAIGGAALLALTWALVG